MRDDPSGAALLDIAHRTLMQELAPTLAGRQRFLALMIGNAVGIVARELAAAAYVQAPDRAAGLVAAIRGGQLDGDAALHAALRQAAIAAVGIAKPGFLSAAERQFLTDAKAEAEAAG